jgi:hypothetical protein
MCNPTARTQLAVMLPNAAAVKWMPTIVNLDFLHDMGRMNGRSLIVGAVMSSAGAVTRT